MSLFNVFELSGSALSVQSVRLNAIATNLANAEAVSGLPEDTYRARRPIFEAVLQQAAGNTRAVAVRVTGIAEDQTPPLKRFTPGHPLADENGFTYLPNVNVIEEMANMMSASRAYQTNVEVMNSSKQLLLRTLTLGQ